MGKFLDFIGKIKGRYFPKPTSQNAVHLNKYDKNVVEAEVMGDSKLAKSIQANAQKVPGYQSLYEDIFGALYKTNPILKSDEDLAPEAKANRERVKNLMESEDYNTFRDETKLNRSISLVTAHKVAESIAEAVPDETERKKSLERSRQKLQKLVDEAEMTESELSEEEQKALQTKIEQAAQAVERAESQMTGADSYEERRAQMAMQRSLSEETAKATDLLSILYGFGYSDEQIDRISPDRMLKMLDMMVSRSQIKKIAELMGRFRKIVRKAMHTSTFKDNFTVSGVSLGGDISQMTDREAVCALHPELQFDFLKRWSNDEIEVYERDDDVPSGKGPIIAAVDISGSMRSPDTKEQWAKALVMAYLEVAKKEHRDMHIIYFDDQLRQVFKIKRGRVTPEELIEIISYFTGGGTNFMYPLRKARDVIRTTEMEKADVLFVTDGEASIDDDFVRKFAEDKKRLNFKVVSVSVEDRSSGWGYSDDGSATTVLQKVSDVVIPVKDLSDENAKAVVTSLYGTG
jgi:uncharacterized protein with von Willebrand factor type A (vWA) domain